MRGFTFTPLLILGTVASLVIGGLAFFEAKQLEQYPQESTFGAVTTTYTPTVLPLLDSTYEIGTSTRAFLRGNFDELCLTADTCKTAWPAGGSGSPGGANTQVQYNDSGSFQGDADFFFTASLNQLTVPRFTATTSTTTKATTTNLFATTASTTNLYLATGSCDTLDTDAAGLIVCGTDSEGSNTGTVATSVNETAGRVAYFTSNSGTPALLGEIATGTLTGGDSITVSATGYTLLNAVDIDCDVASTGQSGCLSAADFTNFNNKISSSSISATEPIRYDSSTGALTFAFSTSSNIAAPQVLYATGANTFEGVATGTVSAGTGISLDNTRYVIGGSLQITNSSPLSGLSTSFPLSFSNPTLSWIGLATSSNIAAPQVLYATGANSFEGAATGTVSGASVISVTSNRYALGGALAITTTGGTFGSGNYVFPSGLTITNAATATNFIATGSSTLQNFTFVNATGTSATTTNLFATTASTSALYLATGSGCLQADSAGLVASVGSNCGTGSAYDAWTHPQAGTSATTSNLVFGTASSTVVGSLNITGNATVTNATTTSLIASILASTTDLWVSNLTSALIITGSDGKFAEYTGTTCTNQFVRSLDALGAATCATVGTADVAGLDISDDTNLAATWPVVLTGDTLSFDAGLTKWATTTSTVDPLALIPNAGVNTLIGIGTTTPHWSLQVASSTGSQIVISDGSLTSNHWNFRNAGGNFYLSTSSPSTFATSSKNGLILDGNGQPSFPYLVSCNTIDTDANGALSCGTDEGGASAYDAWDHPQAGTSATSSNLIFGASSSTVVGGLNITGNATATNATTTALAVSSLTSAAIITDGNGSFLEYAGVSCSNQVLTVLSATIGGTCSNINNDYWSGADLSVANGGTGLSTFGGSNTILYTTAADTLGWEAGFEYNPTLNRLTATNASFTNSTSTNATSTIFSVQNITATGSTTLQAFTFTLATGTAATTTSFSATTINLGSDTSNILVNGKKATSTIVLTAAGAYLPISQGGATGPTQVEYVTNDINIAVIDFASTTATTTCATWDIAMPDSYDGGSVQARFYWTATSSSGTTAWGIRARSFGDDDALDQAYNSTTTVTDALTATNDLMISALTTAFTPAGTPAGGESMNFQVCRDDRPGQGDNFGVSTRLLKVVIEYAKSQFSD